MSWFKIKAATSLHTGVLRAGLSDGREVLDVQRGLPAGVGRFVLAHDVLHSDARELHLIGELRQVGEVEEGFVLRKQPKVRLIDRATVMPSWQISWAHKSG